MSRKFVRNITGTKLTGSNKEPLHTNVQNDLLSDDKDVYVRNKKGYEKITGNIDEIVSDNDNLIVTREGSKVSLNVTGGGGDDYATKEDLNNHITDNKNPHKVTKGQVGLGSVLNIDVNRSSFSNIGNNNTINLSYTGNRMFGYVLSTTTVTNLNLTVNDYYQGLQCFLVFINNFDTDMSFTITNSPQSDQDINISNIDLPKKSYILFNVMTFRYLSVNNIIFAELSKGNL